MGSRIGDPHRKLDFISWQPHFLGITSEQTYGSLPILIHKERLNRNIEGRKRTCSYLSHCEAFLCAVDSVLCSYLTAHSLASSPWQSCMPGKEWRCFNTIVQQDIDSIPSKYLIQSFFSIMKSKYLGHFFWKITSLFSVFYFEKSHSDIILLLNTNSHSQYSFEWQSWLDVLLGVFFLRFHHEKWQVLLSTTVNHEHLLFVLICKHLHYMCCLPTSMLSQYPI